MNPNDAKALSEANKRLSAYFFGRRPRKKRKPSKAQQFYQEQRDKLRKRAFGK